MRKVTYIQATESEIVDLIQEHLNPEFDSIVATEEIGNHSWTVNVEDISLARFLTLRTSIEDQYCCVYTRDYLNMLCSLGFIEAGDYVIDCTW